MGGGELREAGLSSGKKTGPCKIRIPGRPRFAKPEALGGVELVEPGNTESHDHTTSSAAAGSHGKGDRGRQKCVGKPGFLVSVKGAQGQRNISSLSGQPGNPQSHTTSSTVSGSQDKGDRDRQGWLDQPGCLVWGEGCRGPVSLAWLPCLAPMVRETGAGRDGLGSLASWFG